MRNATPFRKRFRHICNKNGTTWKFRFMDYLSWFESRTRDDCVALLPWPAPCDKPPLMGETVPVNWVKTRRGRVILPPWKGGIPLANMLLSYSRFLCQIG